jgi:hypothetical protein
MTDWTVTPLRRRGRVRIASTAQDDVDQDRRSLLHLLAASGGALSAAYLGATTSSLAAPAVSSHPRGSATAAPAALADREANGRVVRDFADPLLEIVRLLREACEVEHALMLQYLYGAFSLKPAYGELAGTGAPTSDDLLGIAVQEMQHLGAVNRLLVTLGAAPQLANIAFPYEPEIYPFEFALEPLTRKSLAKYVYCEAPVGFFDRGPDAPQAKFANAILAALGPKRRPNHVGSLYTAIIDLVRELQGRRDLPDLAPWIHTLEAIKTEGEDGHFKFFCDAFCATHPGFKGHENAWSLPPSHPDYPSYPIAVSPSALVGRARQIDNEAALSLAWLGNLHYWATILLLDHGIRYHDEAMRDIALQHMLGPVMSLGRHLPTLGLGLSFDPLNYSSGPALNAQHSRRLIGAMLREADSFAKAIEPALPADFPRDVAAESIAAIAENEKASAPKAARGSRSRG